METQTDMSSTVKPSTAVLHIGRITEIKEELGRWRDGGRIVEGMT